jgi:hypothetical protein
MLPAASPSARPRRRRAQSSWQPSNTIINPSSRLAGGTSPVSMLQTRTVLSSLPETILLPSVDMATAATRPVCPSSTLSTCSQHKPTRYSARFDGNSIARLAASSTTTAFGNKWSSVQRSPIDIQQSDCLSLIGVSSLNQLISCFE